ncbi:hypothetical protein SUGI_0335500 [Cryptomeria japonica]|nr:hypothetical protein SUGI_0335500 [Cryptomeria japonica]
MHSISFGHGLQGRRFNGKSYYLPALSVSILPDCKHVVFNTAKISMHTSSMAMEKVGLESLLPAKTEISSSDTKPSINWSGHKEPIGIRNRCTNEIDLLSVTFGWQNYGPFFDTWEA